MLAVMVATGAQGVSIGTMWRGGRVVRTVDSTKLQHAQPSNCEDTADGDRVMQQECCDQRGRVPNQRLDLPLPRGLDLLCGHGLVPELMNFGGRGGRHIFDEAGLEQGIGFRGAVGLLLPTLLRDAEPLVHSINDASSAMVVIFLRENVVVTEKVEFFSVRLFNLSRVRDGAIDAGERDCRVAVSVGNAMWME